MATKQASNRDTRPLYQDRINFFSNYSHETSAPFKERKETVDTFNFKSIYAERVLLERELEDLFAVLEKHKVENDAFWVYCYFCACLLKKYYSEYGHPAKVEHYQTIKNNIKQHYVDIDNHNNSIAARDTFARSLIKDLLNALKELAEDIRNAFKELASTPKHAAKIRDRAGYLNLLRVYWVFCRFFLEGGLSLGKAINILDKLDELLHVHIDVDHILSNFEWPAMALSYLSVGLFAVRSIVNIGLIIKHTCFPSDAAAKLGRKTLLANEINKRGVDIVNHSGWAAINVITNFSKICHIPSPVAPWIVAGFLFVDVATLLYKRHEEKKAYRLKRDEYDDEISDLQAIIDKNPDSLKKINCKKRQAILKEQKRVLKVDWETKASTFDLMVGATFMLMLGFSGSMLISAPVGVIACYLVCMIAVAIYLSDEVYAKYKKSSLELDNAKPKSDTILYDKLKLDEAKKAYEAARKEFILTMVKYTLMPTLLITTYAVCLPAAISLTVLMLGYELFKGLLKAYKKHANEKEDQQLHSEDEAQQDENYPAADDDIDLRLSYV